MAIVPAADRIEKYEAFLNSDRLPANLVEYKSTMLAKFSAWVNYLVPLEVATCEYLIGMSAAEWLHASYQAFMRAAARLKQMAPSLPIPDTDKDLLYAIWMSRGLDETMLEYIMNTIVDPMP
jgi:hypothetical protein